MRMISARPAAVLLAAVMVLCGCGGPQGLHGRFDSSDDTGLPDTPVGEGVLLVLATGDASALLGPVSTELGAMDRVDRAVPRADVEQRAADVAAVDGGRFTLDVAPGEYYICYSDSGPTQDPVRVVGCGYVELPTDADLEAGIGEGGFRITVTG